VVVVEVVVEQQEETRVEWQQEGEEQESQLREATTMWMSVTGW